MYGWLIYANIIYISIINYCYIFYIWASHMVLVVKNLPDNSGDERNVGLIPGLGRSPGVGNGTPLQYSCLENSMGRGA